MSASILRPLLAALVCVLALGATARAQVNYTEPPDLSGNLNFPTAVGTVALGLNTIHGTISASIPGTGLPPTGDASDNASFIVPAGLVVTRVEFVVTGYTHTGVGAGGTSSFDNSLQNWWNFSANGTSPNMITTASGALAPGTYGLGVAFVYNIGSAGSISFTWECHITAAVNSNDTCQLATPIGLGATPFDNTTATTDGVAHVAACNFSNGPSIARDLWFTHTPALSGILTVSTCGSSFDTEVNVYNGGTGICPGSDATLLACNDDNFGACGGSGLQSQVAISVAAGQPYLIRVGGYDGSTTAFGPGTLTLSEVSTGACCNRWTGNCTVRGQLDCTSQGLRFDGFGAACSPASCRACPSDFNGSGTPNVQDIFDFLASWFSGCP